MTSILTIGVLDALDEFMDVVRDHIPAGEMSSELGDAYWQARKRIDAWRDILQPAIEVSEVEPVNLIPMEEWPKRAYKQLMYAFMLRGPLEWYAWGMGWDVIERAPLEVVPPLPCYPNWRALPYWVVWWAINGDGTIRAFHTKPTGWVEERKWILGNHGAAPGLPVEMIAGNLGEPVADWYMTLRRRPAHLQVPEPAETPVKAKGNAKKKKQPTA